jgi:hypothetical protein
MAVSVNTANATAPKRIRRLSFIAGPLPLAAH